MAQLHTPSISPKVYRHFAIVTVAVTLILAVFANGENREAIADKVAERHEQARVQRAQIAKFGKRELAPKRSHGGLDWGYGGYGDTYDPAYGKPAYDSTQVVGSSTAWKPRVSPDAAVPGSYAPYGVSQAEWKKMSEAQREAYLRKHAAPQAPISPEQERREVEGLMAASAVRSGVATED